jgi:hypothetical protein
MRRRWSNESLRSLNMINDTGIGIEIGYIRAKKGFK